MITPDARRRSIPDLFKAIPTASQSTPRCGSKEAVKASRNFRLLYHEI